MDNLVRESHDDDHHQLCYVRCSFCNTVLAVGIPWKQLMESSVTAVKCGHCSNLSILTTTTAPPSSLHPHQAKGICSKTVKRQASSSSSSFTSDQEPALSSKAASASSVMKPPEKKHRLPSAYNRFMKEEIQRINAANPKITHREAFSSAAKNWARYIPNSTSSCNSISGGTACNNNNA